MNETGWIRALLIVLALQAGAICGLVAGFLTYALGSSTSAALTFGVGTFFVATGTAMAIVNFARAPR